MYTSDQIELTREDLRLFFIHHLNKLYTAKTTLICELPELLENASFEDLADGIRKTISGVRNQIDRMEHIYRLLPATVSDAGANGLKGLIEDSFEDIKLHGTNSELRDMSMLFYLHNIESIEMASYQILEMVAVKLRNNEIKQLLLENYEEAKADRTLLLLISARYIANA